MRISDWSSDVCSSDLAQHAGYGGNQVRCHMAIHTYRQPPIPPLWSAREKIGCRVVSLRYLAPQVQVALLRCRHFGRRQPMPDTSPTGQLLASFDTPTYSDKDRKSTRLNSSH